MSIQSISILVLVFLLQAGNTLTAQEETYLTDFAKKWKNAGEYTVEFAELMPEEAYEFKPSEIQRTFKEQLLHIMANMTWLSKDYLGGTTFEADLKSTDYTKEEIIQMLKESFAAAGTAASKLELHDLKAKVDFFAGPKNVRQILTLMNDHVTHHRGQLIVYLRLRDIKPPRYRGW